MTTVEMAHQINELEARPSAMTKAEEGACVELLVCLGRDSTGRPFITPTKALAERASEIQSERLQAPPKRTLADVEDAIHEEYNGGLDTDTMQALFDERARLLRELELL